MTTPSVVLVTIASFELSTTDCTYWSLAVRPRRRITMDSSTTRIEMAATVTAMPAINHGEPACEASPGGGVPVKCTAAMPQWCMAETAKPRSTPETALRQTSDQPGRQRCKASRTQSANTASSTATTTETTTISGSKCRPSRPSSASIPL